jgi:hypothetical protein
MARIEVVGLHDSTCELARMTLWFPVSHDERDERGTSNEITVGRVKMYNTWSFSTPFYRKRARLRISGDALMPLTVKADALTGQKVGVQYQSNAALGVAVSDRHSTINTWKNLLTIGHGI